MSPPGFKGRTAKSIGADLLAHPASKMKLLRTMPHRSILESRVFAILNVSFTVLLDAFAVPIS